MPHQELDCKQRARCCHRARPFAECSDQQLEAADTCEEEGFKIPDVPRPGAGDQDIADWAEEVRLLITIVTMVLMLMLVMQVRPSMRKLRQGMDSLLKTSRMMCSVFRLEQSPEAVKLTAEVGIIVRIRSGKTKFIQTLSRCGSGGTSASARR